MAIQLPNFLNAPAADYSGLSDIFQNYYAGKNLPRQDTINEYQAKGAPLDFLMKQIQSQFAKPNAEAALQGARLGNQGKSLSNRQAQMAIQKLQQELANEAKFNAAMKAAQSGQGGGAPPPDMDMGGGMGMGGGQGGMMPRGVNPNMMPMGDSSPSMGAQDPSMMPEAPNMMPNAPPQLGGAEGVRQQQNGTALQKGLMEVMQHQAMKNQAMPTQSPLMQDHPQESAHDAEMQNQPFSDHQPQRQMQELNAGNPAEYFVDKMWNDQPNMRPYLIKRGYKEPDVKEVYDKATGATRVTTTWPSKRKTVTIIPPIISKEALEGDIPLTKSVLNDAVKQVRGTDAVMPYIDKLIDMATPRKSAGGVVNETQLPYFYLHPTDAGAVYEGTIAEAKDKYLKATGITSTTDKVLDTMEKVLSRHFGESDKVYLNRLKTLRKEKEEERKQNVRMITKGLKRYSDFDQSPSGQSYSSNEWEVTGEK